MQLPSLEMGLARIAAMLTDELLCQEQIKLVEQHLHKLLWRCR
jgi:hypothetical protein